MDARTNPVHPVPARRTERCRAIRDRQGAAGALAAAIQDRRDDLSLRRRAEVGRPSGHSFLPPICLSLAKTASTLRSSDFLSLSGAAGSSGSSLGAVVTAAGNSVAP